MRKIAFDSDRYLQLQRDKILDRIKMFQGKLYLEFGGKMFEDFHAARVLPGYEPNNKIRLLTELKDDVELIICINANSIEQSKSRGDLGISYDQEVFRMVDALHALGLFAYAISLFAKLAIVTQTAAMAPIRPSIPRRRNVRFRRTEPINRPLNSSGRRIPASYALKRSAIAASSSSSLIALSFLACLPKSVRKNPLCVEEPRFDGARRYGLAPINGPMG